MLKNIYQTYIPCTRSVQVQCQRKLTLGKSYTYIVCIFLILSWRRLILWSVFLGICLFENWQPLFLFTILFWLSARNTILPLDIVCYRKAHISFHFLVFKSDRLNYIKLSSAFQKGLLNRSILKKSSLTCRRKIGVRRELGYEQEANYLAIKTL